MTLDKENGPMTNELDPRLPAVRQRLHEYLASAGYCLPKTQLIVPLEQGVISGLLFGLTGWLIWYAAAHSSLFILGLAALSGCLLGGWFVLVARLNRP